MIVTLIFACIAWITAVCLIGAGVICLKQSEENDKRSTYFRAIARLWITYGLCFILSGVMIVFHRLTGGIILGLTCFPGLFILFIIHKSIEEKYNEK